MATSPTAASTRILGAAKVTGRMPGGFSIGVMDVVTDNVAGIGGRTLEPATNYAVARGNQDLDNGDASLGFIATAVNRSLDPSTDGYLHDSAYSGGLDARRRFSGTYEVSGSFDISRVAGTARGHRAHPAGSGASVPASGRTARVRFDPHLADRHQHGGAVRQGRRARGSSSRPRISGAPRASRSTTSDFSARPTSSSGPPGRR